MKRQPETDPRVVVALERVQPRPNRLYNLDAAAHLARVPRRTLLRYCQAGVIQPSLQPPYGLMMFSEESIRTIRAIEHWRFVDGLEFGMIKTLLGLLDELEQLRAELRFRRSR